VLNCSALFTHAATSAHAANKTLCFLLHAPRLSGDHLQASTVVKVALPAMMMPTITPNSPRALPKISTTRILTNNVEFWASDSAQLLPTMPTHILHMGQTCQACCKVTLSAAQAACRGVDCLTRIQGLKSRSTALRRKWHSQLPCSSWHTVPWLLKCAPASFVG
jgi:hypothetical protein